MNSNELIAWVIFNSEILVKQIHFDYLHQFWALKTCMIAYGIVCAVSSTYKAQPNGLAERVNSTLLNRKTFILKFAGLSKDYLGEALLHGTYVYNSRIKFFKQKIHIQKSS